MMFRAAALGVAMAVLAGGAFAQSCPCVSTATRVNGVTELTDLLKSSTVCAALPPDRWQEFHEHPSFRLFEMGNVVGGQDVGSWAVNGAGNGNGNATVTYTYTGSSPAYTYTVCTEGSNIHFCGATHGGRDVKNATKLANRVNCAAPVAPAGQSRTSSLATRQTKSP